MLLLQSPTQNVPTISDSVAASTMIGTLKASANTTTSVVANLIASNANAMPSKPKVSFRDRIKSLQHSDGSKQSSVMQLSSSQSSNTVSKDIRSDSDDKEQLLQTTAASSSASTSTTSNRISAALTFREKLRQMSSPHSAISSKSEDLGTMSQLRPWSKLKLATVLSGASSYASLNNSMCETSPTHQTKPSTSSCTAKAVKTKFPESVEKRSTKQKSTRLERSCISDSEIRNVEHSSSKKKCRVTRGQSKIYRSVDDLSPEYSGLPFVKKLKILNERQKLAELESIQAKSASLDYPEWCEDMAFSEPLIRSQSEGSRLMAGQSKRPANGPSTTMLSATSALPTPPLISPESNETLERRELKSILKKLSEETSGTRAVECSETETMRGLLRAPTVEGYVARHSKFLKSVTFNSTLSSPPTSAHSAIDEREPATAQTASSSFPFQSSAQLIDDDHQPQLSTADATIDSENPFLLLSDSTTNQISDLEKANIISDNIAPTAAEAPLNLSDQQRAPHYTSPNISDSQPLPIDTTNPFLSDKIQPLGK